MYSNIERIQNIFKYLKMVYIIVEPMLKPLMNDENSSYITNQSAYFNWKINMTECSKLNGFFRGYQVILKVSIIV